MKTPITDSIRAYSEGKKSLDEALADITAVGHIQYKTNQDSVWAWDIGDSSLDSFGQMDLAFFQLNLTPREKLTFRSLIQSLAQGGGKQVAAHLPGQHDQSSHGRRGDGSSLPDGDGDCYVAALNDFMERGISSKGTKLVHGTPTGQGPIEGIKFGHAWVEEPDPELPGLTWVVDKSNGGDTRMPVALYYRIGRIDPSEVSKYSYEEMVAMVDRFETYGPWE